MTITDYKPEGNIEEHWIEINGREKINKEIDYSDIVVDKSNSEVRDKVVRWFSSHEDSFVKGYLHVNTETSEVDHFTIKDLHHKGEMNRKEIIEFLSMFSGMYDFRVVDHDPKNNKVHFQIHFD